MGTERDRYKNSAHIKNGESQERGMRSRWENLLAYARGDTGGSMQSRVLRDGAGVLAVGGAGVGWRGRRPRTKISTTTRGAGGLVSEFAARADSSNTSGEHAVGAEADTRAADPGRVLARGYSITRAADGLREMHARKTGALIRASVAAGAIFTLPAS